MKDRASLPLRTAPPREAAGYGTITVIKGNEPVGG